MPKAVFEFPVTAYLVVSSIAPDAAWSAPFRPDEIIDETFYSLARATQYVQDKQRDVFARLAADPTASESYVERMLVHRKSFRVVKARLVPNG